ncbi:hypothetical protein J4E89_002492 [Alternaria sp. Ai002NY15]|nr:hypothetical protein J4E89_002492 [Alternaria sp. Ai002NY15]
MTTDCMSSSSTRPLQLEPKGDRISKRQVDSIISQITSAVGGVPSDTPEYVDTSVFTAPPAAASTQVIVSTVTPTAYGGTPDVVTVIRTFTPSETPLPSETGSTASSVASELVPPSSTASSPISSTESSDGASAPQSSDGNEPTAASQNNGSGSSGLGGGAIAGIAIAAVLVIAVIGGWLFWRRRKRMRAKLTSTEITAHIAGNGDGDGERGIPELDTKERPQEMPGSHQVQSQELDPTQYTKYAMNGSHELKTEPESAELLNGPDEHTAPVPYHVQQTPADETTEIRDTTEATSNSLSSNVEAQRRREIEWLEMEGERIRKRRELLAAQGSAKS